MSIQSVAGTSLITQPTPAAPARPGDAANAQTSQDTVFSAPIPTAGSATSTATPDSQNNTKNQHEDVVKAVKKLNDFVSSASSDVVFSVDKDTDIRVIKVVDRKTKEVIRQLPSEEALRIAKTLDRFQGLLVRDKA